MMKRIKTFSVAVCAIALLASCKKDYDDGYIDEGGGGQVEIDWDKAADSSTNALIEKFWNASGKFFNRTNNDTYFNYWPQAHALDVLVDAYERTEDDRYRTLMDEWMTGVRQKNGNTFLNEFYDDMEWNALAMLRAYDATGDNKFREAINPVWADIKNGWNTIMGGGIAWRKAMPYYKNTPANAPAAILAARLYRRFENPEDLEWSRRIFRYVKDSLYNRGTGFVYDGINSENDGVRNTTWKFTYNQGTFIGAALELYAITNEVSYLNDALQAANFTLSDNVLTNFTDNLMRDEGGGDGGLFKGVLVRYMTNLIQTPGVLSSDKQRYLNYLRHNARTLWTEGTNKSYLLFGTYWKNPPTGTETDLTVQLSGAMLIEAMTILDEL